MVGRDGRYGRDVASYRSGRVREWSYQMLCSVRPFDYASQSLHPGGWEDRGWGAGFEGYVEARILKALRFTDTLAPGQGHVADLPCIT